MICSKFNTNQQSNEYGRATIVNQFGGNSTVWASDGHAEAHTHTHTLLKTDYESQKTRKKARRTQEPFIKAFDVTHSDCACLKLESFF